MDDRIDLVDLDFEYKIWKNTLSHFLNEHEIIEGRLRELADGHVIISKEQQKKYTDQIHVCLKRIVLQEEQMAAYSRDFPISKKHEIFEFHLVIKKQIRKIKETQLEFLKLLDGYQNWKS